MDDAQLLVRLPICPEVLRRALYLHRWANKYRHVAADLRFTKEAIAAHGWADMGWVELRVRKFVSDIASHLKLVFEHVLRTS